MRKALLVFVLLLCMSYALAEGNLSKIRPGSLQSNYLSNEDLVYYSCPEQANADVRNSLYCLDDSTLVNLDSMPWEDDCTLSTYNLENIDCQDLLLQSEYISNNDNVKMTDQIRIRRVNSVLKQVANGQKADGSWGDPISTAYALFAYSSFPEAYEKEIQDGLDWLKENRDNTEKCYPEDSCDIKTTATVAGMLNLGGSNTSLRVVHDSLIWLLTKQNVIPSGAAWKINFTPSRNLTNTTTTLLCLFNTSLTVVTYNFSYVETNSSGNITNYTSPPYIEVNFSAISGRRLDLLCTGNISMNLTTHDSELALTYLQGDNVTYTIPDPCWADQDKWDACTSETTMFAMLGGISEDYRDLALPFLDEQAKSSAVGNYFDVSDMTLNAFYLFLKEEYYEESNSSMLQYLFYNQNNDGSYGSGTAEERVEDTANVIMALELLGLANGTEFLEDAKDWVSANEPSSGWSTIPKASLAVNALKSDIRPFLKTDPIHIQVTATEHEVTLYNPSTFDLTDLSFEFSENFEDVLILSAFDTLEPDTSRKLKITQTGKEPTENFGYLIIEEGIVEIARIPVSVFKYETIDMSYPDSLTLFGTSATLKLQVSKSSATFQCTIAWDSAEISSLSQVEVSTQSEIALGLNLKTTQRRQEEFTGQISCVAGRNTKRIPLRVTLNQYPSMPFAVGPRIILINETEQDVAFSIENLLTEPITANVAFAQSEPYFQLESTSVVVNPKSSKEVKIVNLIPKGFNLSSTTKVTIESLGQTDSIILATDIEVSSVNFIIFSAFAVLALAVMTAVGILYREKLTGMDAFKNVMAMLPSSIGGVPKQINTLQDAEKILRGKQDKDESKVKLNIIMNSIRILENAKKTEDQIRKKLSQEGFSETEINDSYKELEAINKDKQDLSEKKSNVAIIDTLNKNSAIIRTKLKAEGFSDKQIQVALGQLRNDYKEKEKILKESLAEKDVKIKE